ncbi:hypothetical protein [Paenibacillus sp. FSL K6-1230]
MSNHMVLYENGVKNECVQVSEVKYERGVEGIPERYMKENEK